MSGHKSAVLNKKYAYQSCFQFIIKRNQCKQNNNNII